MAPREVVPVDIALGPSATVYRPGEQLRLVIAGRWLSPLGGHPLAGHVLLVETPADGLVRIDTGPGPQDYADISRRLGKGFAYAYARPTIDPALAALIAVLSRR